MTDDPNQSPQTARAEISRLLAWGNVAAVALLMLFGIAANRYLGENPIFYVIAALLATVETWRTFEITLLNAARNQRAMSLWLFFESLLRQVCAISAVLIWGASPGSILGGYLAGTLATYIGKKLLVRRDERHLPAVQPSPVLRKQIIRFSLPLAPLAFVGWINSISDRYVIGALAGVAAVGVYSVTYGLITQAFGIVFGKMLALWFRPIYFEAVARNQRAAEKQIFNAWLLTAGLGCVLATLLVTLLRHPLTALLLADEYREAAKLMPILAIGLSLMTIADIFNATCMAHKRTKRVLAADAIAAGTAIVGSVPLVIYCGATGAAIATCVTYFVQLTCVICLSRNVRLAAS